MKAIAGVVFICLFIIAAGLAAALLCGRLAWLLARRYRGKVERDLSDLCVLTALYAAEVAARDCQCLTGEEMAVSERRSVALGRIEELRPRIPIPWLETILDNAAAQVKAVYPEHEGDQDQDKGDESA